MDFHDGTGKPKWADLKAGLATAPVLLAREQFPQLQTLISRKFQEPGDIEEAVTYVAESGGLERTEALAVEQAELACHTLSELPPSLARDGLARLAQKVIQQTIQK